MFEKFSIRFVFVIIVYLESREILGFKMEDEGGDSDSEKITAIVSLPFCSVSSPYVRPNTSYMPEPLVLLH